jgi:phospholipid transport system substrate-binding protein
MKRLIPLNLVLVGLLFLSGIVPVQAQSDPTKIIQETTSAVVARVKTEKAALRAAPAKMYALVAEMIFPHFDFNIMSQWVLGPAWKTADEATRQAFVEQFRKLLVRTYATALLEYSDETMEYPPVEPSHNPKTATVKQNIVQTVGKVLPVVYRLHEENGEWQVFDVEVDGISLVKTFKSSFSQILNEGGVDELLKSLKAKNRDLGA